MLLRYNREVKNNLLFTACSLLLTKLLWGLVMQWCCLYSRTWVRSQIGASEEDQGDGMS